MPDLPFSDPYQPLIQPADPWPRYTFSYPTPISFMRFNVPNKRVAVEPFPPAAKAQVKGGVVQLMNQAETVGLKVLFPSATYAEGNVVYVRAKLRETSSYGKEIFEVEGKRFILLPEEEVLLVDMQPIQPAVVEPMPSPGQP